MQMLGFNAVRLPFSFKDFRKVPNAISYGCSQVLPPRPQWSVLAPNNLKSRCFCSACKLLFWKRMESKISAVRLPFSLQSCKTPEGHCPQLLPEIRGVRNQI